MKQSAKSQPVESQLPAAERHAGRATAPTIADHHPASLSQRRLAAAILDSPRTAVQRRLVSAIQHSPRMVVQRSPELWGQSADMRRMLGLAHGWFSTWKKIKAAIGAYRELNPAALDARLMAMRSLETLIAEWEADPKHSAASTDPRVISIRTDIPVLKHYVRREQNEIEDGIFAGYYQTGEVANPDIPDELTAGIAALPGIPAKAVKLFQNINSFRFRYTGNFVNPQVAYEARQGDCQTLVGLYQNVALAMGIPFAVGHRPGRQLVGPHAINGRTDTSNTEDNDAWYFREHYWVIGNGTAYDLLFKVSPPVAHAMTNGSAVHNGVTYHTFGDGRCVIEPDEVALNYEISGEGKVFANAASAQAFIDAHH